MALNLPPRRHLLAGTNMRVLVTGGTGVLGAAAVNELHRRGHTVRVLSRHAWSDQMWWPDGVDGWTGDVADAESLRGAAEDCDVVVHIAGIVDETPPQRTFERVNINGSRYVVMEAERAGVRKLVYVSSLGADRGTSAYQRSKCVGEDVVRAFSRDWVVVRPGAVYGPGDEHVSLLLQMVRTLPVVPTIGDGNQRFQPIWHEDVGRALADAVERDDVRCMVLDVAGAETTSENDLVERFRRLTDRRAPQAPIPEVVASWGLRLLDAIGIDVPFNAAELAMLREGNVITEGHGNALIDVLHVAPTSLDEGLHRLVNEQPEQLPSEGVGPLRRRRFWIDIRGSRFTPESLLAHVRAHLAELMPPPIAPHPEPAGETAVEEGSTLTLHLPLRGHVQVRVAEAEPRRLTLLTVQGHPFAGALRFLSEQRDGAVRFEIQVYERAATAFDELALRAIGTWMQRATWTAMAKRVARAAGGTHGAVEMVDAELDEHGRDLVDAWAAVLADHASGNFTSRGRD